MAYQTRRRSGSLSSYAVRSAGVGGVSADSIVSGQPVGATDSQAAASPADNQPAAIPIKRNLYVRSLPQEARRGNFEAVRQLVEEHGASLDEEVVGETALHFACFYGHLPVVTFLLSRPECHLNKRNLGGNTPLMRAVENGHPGVVALLLDAAKRRDKPIAKRRNMKGETALHKAAATGNVEVARLLVEEGRGSVDVSAHTHPDYGGDTPLHVAAERGHWPMLLYLLSIRDPSSSESAAAAIPSPQPPPLSPVAAAAPAAAAGAPPVVSATRTAIPRPLRSVGAVAPVAAQKVRRTNVAHVDARNTKGRTSAHMPVVSGKRDMKESERLEGLKVLAEAGADLNARDASGRTPLHWAVFANYTRIVEYLLHLGKSRVDASIQDGCGYTPAHIAINRERAHLARVLEHFVADQPWEDLLARLGQEEAHPNEDAEPTTTKRRRKSRKAEEEEGDDAAEEDLSTNTSKRQRRGGPRNKKKEAGRARKRRAPPSERETGEDRSADRAAP